MPTGSAFKVFALVAALEQGIGLGYQVDSSPLEVDGIKITNVEGGSCGTCNIAEALKRSLNTAYYRLMLKLKNGPSDVADAAHQAGIAESFPGVEHTLSEDGKGGPPNNGIVLGQYQSRVLDMASAYATIAASGVYHAPHFVQKVVNAEGQVLFDAADEDNSGEQRIDKAVADNVTAAMQPIAAYSNGHALAGGRPSAAKTGTNQLGDTGDNRDAWMVGFTPSLSTAVWVGTTDGTKPLENKWGSPVYGSGLPSDIWKNTMDGALEDTDNESFPKPTEIGGYAGPPAPPPPPPPAPAPPSETVIQPTIEVAPGITIPFGPPTTVPIAPPGQPVPAAEPGRGAGRAGSAGSAGSTGSWSASRRFRPRDRERGYRRRTRGGARGRSVPRCRRSRWPPTVRSADDRDLPSRTDALAGALSQVIGGPVGRHALIGRARFLTPLAGHVGDRRGVPRAGLHDEGGVPGDHRLRHRRPEGRQLAEPAGVLRAVLLRHRPALHRGTAEPGQVSVQVELDRERQRGQAAEAVRRQYRRAVHGVSGHHRYLPVHVDGTGQDLLRAEQAGRGAVDRRGGDVLQHLRVRAGPGVVRHGVGHRRNWRADGSGMRRWSQARRS